MGLRGGGHPVDSLLIQRSWRFAGGGSKEASLASSREKAEANTSPSRQGRKPLRTGEAPGIMHKRPFPDIRLARVGSQPVSIGDPWQLSPQTTHEPYGRERGQSGLAAPGRDIPERQASPPRQTASWPIQ